MIPGLDRGFIYRGETGKDTGGGTLAVQPMVEGPSGPVLLDELVGPNFAILSKCTIFAGMDGFGIGGGLAAARRMHRND